MRYMLMNKALHPVFAACLAGSLLLSAGCSVTPPSPPDDKVTALPTPVETPPAAPQPAVIAPVAPAKAPVAPAVAVVPKSEPPIADQPVAKAPVKPAVAAAPAPKPQSAAPAAAPAPLALDTLEQRLKDTPAIGVFTKLTLKNQVDDLLSRFRAHYEGRGGLTIPQLRQNYEQLLAKVHGLLKDGDPALAGAIVNSREAIWSVLADPAKFAKL
jgi:hypothetical protein